MVLSAAVEGVDGLKAALSWKVGPALGVFRSGDRELMSKNVSKKRFWLLLSGVAVTENQSHTWRMHGDAFWISC